MRFIDLNEGPNDPNIFKAIFLAGGPGSGKSFVSSQLALTSSGLRTINSDDALEYLMMKHGLDLTMPPEEQSQRDAVRTRAKQITKTKQQLALDGRLGLVIDGTAKDVAKMAKLKRELEAIGYQTMMVFVNTSLKTAMQRNNMRPRRVPTDIVVKSHKEVQTNKIALRDLFGATYLEVDNEGTPKFDSAYKTVQAFLRAPLTPTARDWLSKASLQNEAALDEPRKAGSKPKVFVDMDGVIANFYAGMSKLTGHPEPRAMQDLESEVRKLAGTDFFYQLPKYEQAEELLGYINKMTGGDWYILSSPLSNDKEASAAYKKAWIRDKLDHKPRGAYFTGQKEQFATQEDGTPNILIDDYPGYLTKWRDKGGIGVQYKGHVGNIQDVKDVLDQHFGNTESIEEAKESVKDQIEKAYIQDGGSIDEYYVRSASVDKLGYSAKQTFGRSPDIGDDNFSVDYIGYGKGKPALWFYPLSYYLKRVADVAYGNDMPHVWLVRIKPNAWLQPVSNNNVTKQDAPKGKERVGLLRKSAVPAAIFFKPGFDVVDKFYDYGSQHKRHGEVKGAAVETIRKVDGGYRLLSKKGKNLGTYPSKTGAEKRERQVQYFKHMGEKAPVEPDEFGYQHSYLTAPQNTLVIDKSDDMDFYKLGQHYTSLATYDKHELGVGPADMTITFASPEEMERMKAVFDKLGVVYKDISGSHEQPEIHTKSNENVNVKEDVTQSDLDQIELYADRLFSKVGIDINFTRHFVDRVNDERNKRPITPSELTRLFKQEFKRWGKNIAQMGPDAEAVMKDMQTDVNMPFVLKWDSRNQELDLVAKTIMRKQDFKSPDPVFAVVEATDKCPPATQSIDLNLKNRQKAIERYGYGPLNPDEPNNKFWAKKAKMWQLDSVDEAKKSICANCAAFDITKKSLDCIAKGIGAEGDEDPFDVIDAGHLGYCRFLKFKCAAARTCDAWVVGGPIQDKEVSEALDSSYPYEFKNNAYYFTTDEGTDYKVTLKGLNKVEVSFYARGENSQEKDNITGTGDSLKVFGTVINIVKDYVGQNQPDILMFTADNSEPSRVRLYNTLASQASRALPGYKFAKTLKAGLSTTFYLTRDDVKVPKLDIVKNLAGRALDKVVEDNVSSHRKEVNEEFKSVSLRDAIMDFLPIAKAHLKLEKLPKIKLVTKIGDSEVPTFGRYNDVDKAIHVAKGKRHPVDIIRTLAHELVHYAQGQNNELRPGDGKDGSPIEDEANSEAGVMLRKFSKKFPQYIKKGKPE